jgi:26S proteasome non-ATPase regulatory subunit 9
MSEAEAKKALAALDVKRKALEMEADALHAELTLEGPEGQPPMGVDTPLVDRDGYPRADIDVYRARTLRGRLKTIQTDHKAIMRDIEKGLAQLAALKQPTQDDQAELEARKAKKPLPKFDAKSGKWVVQNWDGSVAGVANGDQRTFETLEEVTPPVSTESSRGSASQQQDSSTTTPKPTEPFAVIDAVASNSPAQQAGLLVGDQVVEFGSINHTNHKNLMALGELVPEAASNKQPVQITVLRQTDELNERIREFEELTLYPQPWEGRGLLGCHIVKYTGPN